MLPLAALAEHRWVLQSTACVRPPASLGTWPDQTRSQGTRGPGLQPPSEPWARCRAENHAPARFHPGIASLWPEMIYIALNAHCPLALPRQTGSLSWLLASCHRRPAIGAALKLLKKAKQAAGSFI